MMNLTVVNEERYVLWMDWKTKKLGRSYKVMTVKLASVSEQCELCNEESRHLCYTEDDGHICIECLNDFYVAEELGYDSASDSEPEEKTVPAYTKVFEYVRSNELGVVFKQKGVLVKIGWNPSDARPYIKVDGKPMKPMMIQSAIDSFKPFSNGVHGDIARIVKALVRVRKMPASVRVKQEERKRVQTHNKPKQENVSPAERKENTLVTRYSGTVDASWLVEFRELFVSNNERQPTGYEIRDAWLRCGA